MLTQKMVNEARYDPDGPTWQALTDAYGLILRLNEKGDHRFAWRYYLGGKDRYKTLGPMSHLTLEDARREVLALREQRALGADPMKPSQDAITFKAFIPLMVAKHLPSIRQASKRVFLTHFNRDILPVWGNRMLREITPQDVRDVRYEMRDKPSYANRFLQVLNVIYNKAREWGYTLPQDNPTRYIDRFPETPRMRFLSDEEIRMLGEVLEDWKDQDSADAIRMLLYTGARKNEIVKLEWEWVDSEFRWIDYPEGATKTGGRRMMLSKPAQEILRRRWNELGLRDQIEGYSIYAFPNRRGDGWVNLWYQWNKIRSLIGADDVRLHDLRHTYASIAAGLGQSLHLIGGQLGHKTETMTARYSHLSQGVVADATDEVGSRLADLI
jgi:integrase